MADGVKRPTDLKENKMSNVNQLLADVDHRHLDALEEEAIFILREVAASFERPALLFSSGKDSCVVLHLAEKAFKMKNAQGKLEGKREGKLEGKLEAAKNFLAMGLPVDKVAKGTGLSEEEVRALQNP